MANADRLIEVFDQAKARPPGAERDRFLAETCQNEPELMEQVVSLLQSDEGAGDFLKHSLLSPPATITEKPGYAIGRYKLLEKIGEGGCGVVYIAEQIEPVRRRVALKVIKLGMDTKQVVTRFEAERQALAMMDHPNIAKVLDAGSTDTGRPYFVMELVRGLRITDYCDQNNLSSRERLDLFIKVCQAVQHAHQKGIIHRDLKPSNILVSQEAGAPVPKVIDFGIAKATAGRLTDGTVYTQLLHFIGTPAYMSPEQAEMTALDVDTRSDIYSLGVLLYELLTDNTPFDAKELLASGLDEMRHTIREQEPMRPSARLIQTLVAAEVKSLKSPAAPTGFEEKVRASSRRPWIKETIILLKGDLDWIVMKCLEKDRSRRYETANGLAADLQRHLNNEPVSARPPTAVYRFQKAFRRNKLLFGASGAVALAMLLALVGLAVGVARISAEKNLKDLALREKGAALVDAKASAQAAKDQLFLALLNQARASRFSGQMGQRLGSLQALTEAALIRSDPRLRDEAIAAMALPDIRLGPRWPVDSLRCVDGSYRLSANVDAKGTIIVRSVPDRREIIRIPSRPGEQLLLFSDDGRFLAQIDETKSLHLWRVADGQSVLSDTVEMCSDVVFSHDGHHLYAGQEDMVLHFDLMAGSEVNRWQVQGRIHSLAMHPDNREVAVGYEDPAITSIYDAAEGRHLVDLPVESIHEQVVAWHPDGVRLAVGGTDPRIQIWDVSTREKLAILEGDVQRITHLSFHPDGELLASRGWDGICRLWHPSSGRQLMQFPRQIVPLAFSKDGRWLGGTGYGESGQLVEIASCPEYRTVSNLGAGRGEYQDGDITPDGRILALSMAEGVRLWELSNLRELAFLPIGRTVSAIFQPDGRELLTCGPSGLYRWPISDSNGDPPSPLRLGPRVKILIPFEPVRADRSPDGRTLAVVSERAGGALLVDLTTGSVHGALKTHPSAGFVALSPDGQWMATTGWHSDRMRLWNVASGELVRDWGSRSFGRASFTPDSRTLILSHIEEFTFWDVRSFQEIRRLPCEVPIYPNQLAFSPDGTLMAIELSPGIIHLKEIRTGREIAKLEDPHADRTTWMKFTPDGIQLVAASNFAKTVHVWDLRAIRVRLKEMGLDWDWPEFPQRTNPADRVRYPQNDLRIEVIKEPTSVSSPGD